jgi:hypothetical protein
MVMPRNPILICLLVFFYFGARSQGLTCAESDPFCTGTVYNFPAGTTGAAESGPYYGCLSTRPAPAWYHMKIGNPGSISIYMYSTPLVDIDFICWGPFADPTSPCPNGLTQSKMVDCSYSANPTETVDIPNGQTGEYYILLITNYSQQTCNITFSQTGGNGSTDCSILPPMVSSDSPLCVGDTLHLTAEEITNATYTWTGPAGFTSNLRTPVIPNVTLAQAGDYSCVITVNSQTSPAAVTTVIINPLPDAAIITTSVTTCPGDDACIPLQLTGAGPFEVIYYDGWTFYTVPGLTGPVDSIYVNPPGPATYQVTQVSDTNCTKSLTGLTFQVLNFPAATGVLSGGEIICQGDTAELTFNLTGTAPWTITYLANGMNPVTIVADYTPFYVAVTPATTTTYHFSQLSDAHCLGTASGDAVVTVDFPTGSMSGNNTICSGDGAQLLFVLTGFPPWTISYTANGSDEQTVTATYSPFSVSVNPMESTLYEFTQLLDVHCTGTANGQAMIEVHKPTGVLSGAATICAGEDASILFDLTGNPPWTIIYSENGSNPQTIIAYSTPYSVVVSPALTAHYTFSSLEDNSCPGTTSGSADITVNPLPLANAGDDKSVANGTSTTLQGSVSGGSGSYTYQWEPAAMLVNSQVLQPVTVNLYSSTLFTLTITDNNGGCTGEDDVLVTVTGGVLSSTAHSNPTVICNGETSQLQVIASGGSGNYSYLWSSYPIGFSSDLANPVVNPAISTTYAVVVNDGYNVTQSNTSITVNQLPVPDAGQDQVIIFGTNTTLHAAAGSGSGAYVFHWEPAYLLNNPDISDPTTAQLYETTVFNLTVTDSQTGCACSGPDAVAVMISGDALTTTPMAQPNTICAGDSTQLFSLACGGTGIFTYSWTSDPPGFSSVTCDPVVAPMTSTVYHVFVDDGYNSSAGTVGVTVNPTPTVILGGDTIVCVFDTLTIDAGNPGASYIWSNGSTDRTINVGSTGIGYENKVVTVTVISPEGCEATAQRSVSFDFVACSGVGDLASDAGLRIFPNPGNGLITIENTRNRGTCYLSVLNSQGVYIINQSKIYFSAFQNQYIVDLRNYKSGIYLIKVIGTDAAEADFKYILNH